MAEKKQKHQAARKNIPPGSGGNKTQEEDFCGKLLKKTSLKNPVSKPAK